MFEVLASFNILDISYKCLNFVKDISYCITYSTIIDFIIVIWSANIIKFFHYLT